MLSSRQNLVILFERGGPKLEISLFAFPEQHFSFSSPHFQFFLCLYDNEMRVYVCVNVLYEDYLCAWNISGAFEDSARGNIP